MGTVYYGADLGEKEKDFVYVINFLINMDNLLSINKCDYDSSIALTMFSSLLSLTPTVMGLVWPLLMKVPGLPTVQSIRLCKS